MNAKLDNLTTIHLAVDALHAESETQYKAIIQASIDGFLLLDMQGRFLDANDAFCNMLGYSKPELMKLDVSKVNIEESPQDTAQRISRLIANGSDRFETRHRCKDGRIIDMEISVNYSPLHGGRIFSFQRDITERKKEQEVLRVAKIRAEAASLAKSQFIANMSHEIRTPMNSVIGFTDLALSCSNQEEQLGYLKHVKDSSALLMTILNDLIDMSKIEAGQTVIEYSEFNLAALLQNATQIASSQAQDKGLEFTLISSNQIPDLLIGDQAKLRKILLNLLSNAIKFTEQGHVSLEVNVIEIAEHRETISLSFCIKDTGIGIAREQFESLFEPFVQADNTISRRFGGTGLGLSISRNLARLMNGDISVESSIGLGSSFTLQLQFALPA